MPQGIAFLISIFFPTWCDKSRFAAWRATTDEIAARALKRGTRTQQRLKPNYEKNLVIFGRGQTDERADKKINVQVHTFVAFATPNCQRFAQLGKAMQTSTCTRAIYQKITTEALRNQETSDIYAHALHTNPTQCAPTLCATAHKQAENPTYTQRALSGANFQLFAHPSEK